MLIDALAPNIGKDGGVGKKQSGLVDDPMKEKVERRKRAMARQKKILEEFMSKQEMFKEQHLSTGTFPGFLKNLLLGTRYYFAIARYRSLIQDL